MIIHFFVLTLTAIIVMLCVSPKTTTEWPELPNSNTQMSIYVFNMIIMERWGIEATLAC